MPEIPIDICVCTFRRPQVADTLRSIAQLDRKPDWKIRVIVADNDETPAARGHIEATAREHAFDLTYIHAPARNISVARNACLDAASAGLAAFIDDDEVANPLWLDRLMAAMDSSKADVVLGPVRPVYGPGSPEWMRDGDFHATKPVWVGGQIITGYTCNVLMNRTASVFRGLRFRKELGRTGGEDTFFFSALHKAGARFAYAPEAIVTEIVPPARASMGYLLKRSFRSGQTHGLLLLENNAKPAAQLRNIALASSKALFCFIAALPNVGRAVKMRYWILRGALHLGVVARLLSARELEQYG